jgi:hypothetical protein
MAQDGLPGDLAMAVRSLPRVGRLPSPWETRALAALFEYRRHKLNEAMEGEEHFTQKSAEPEPCYSFEGAIRLALKLIGFGRSVE